MLTMCVDVLRSRFRPMLALRCLAVVGALFAGLPVANADLVRSISTGLNASENLQMLGGVDANYSLITSADPSVPGPDALVVFTNAFPFPYWVANTSTSQWISPDAHGATEPDGLYVFQMTFDLTGYDASTALISGLWATDNDGLDIKLNGVSTGYTTGQFVVPKPHLGVLDLRRLGVRNSV